MSSGQGDQDRLGADAWRRIGAVLDRLSDVSQRGRPHALEDACRAEGVRVEDVRPYLEADDQSDQFPGQLDPVMLKNALQPLVADAAAVRLAAGTCLGRYEILSLVGAGGMGEVYKARDTRLNRIVALKRLTAHMAESQEGRARFEREAQITSTLNHPHICTLHDVGEHEGVGFLVMEFTEGETLAARLQRGPMSMSDTIECALQMTDAVATAHRQGIVHRDLKPANLMLTARGIKVLDFGLAALRPLQGSISGAPEDGSTPGMILGTLHYMAPEQLQGKPVDGRADIFAIGAILYEMLAGRKAFDADSPAGVVAAVLDRTPPPLSAHRPDVPAELERGIAQCLIKGAEDRWQNAADLAQFVQSFDTSRTAAVPQPAPRSAGPRALARRAVAAAVAVLAAGAITYFLFQWRPWSTPVAYRFDVQAPIGTSYEGLFAISPDGRRLAFTTTDAAGVRSLWIRPLEGLAAQRVESTDGALHPFWSPDGGSVGFFAHRKLKVVDLATGTVRVLSDTASGGGGTWNANGIILFADESTATARPWSTGLRRVPASGGIATPATRFTSDEWTIQAHPHFLPDGRHYLFMQLGMREPGVYVGQLDDDEPTRVLPALVTTVAPRHVNVYGPARATYAAGHIFYLGNSDRALMAQAFAVKRLQLIGSAVRIAEDVENSAPGLSAYDVSATGTLVYRPMPQIAGATQLALFNRASASSPLVVLTNWPSLLRH